MADSKSEPPRKTREQATKEKGYPHPGSMIQLPDQGGEIHFQFGHPQEVGRNGIYMSDLLEAITDHLEVFQSEDAKLADEDTGKCIESLKAARGHLEARKAKRRARGVLNTDKE